MTPPMSESGADQCVYSRPALALRALCLLGVLSGGLVRRQDGLREYICRRLPVQLRLGPMGITSTASHTRGRWRSISASYISRAAAHASRLRRGLLRHHRTLWLSVPSTAAAAYATTDYGNQSVESGGTADYTYVESGRLDQYVYSGGLAFEPYVYSGGGAFGEVLSGGKTDYANIYAGGYQYNYGSAYGDCVYGVAYTETGGERADSASYIKSGGTHASTARPTPTPWNQRLINMLRPAA